MSVNRNLKPRLLVVHRRGDRIVGYEHTDTPAWVEAPKYPVRFTFEGRTEAFVVVSNDETIQRGECLKFATLVHDGLVRWINVDLSKL